MVHNRTDMASALDRLLSLANSGIGGRKDQMQGTDGLQHHIRKRHAKVGK